MLRAPALLIAALALAVPASAVADTKAEKAAKKKKAKAAKAKADKAKADAEAAEAAEEEEATPEVTPDAADAELLKSKADAETEEEAEKAKAEAAAAEQEAKPVEDPEPAPAPAPVARALTLPKGQLVIGGSTANINLSTDAVAKPISLAPSVWFGITDKISVGVTHDGGTTAMSPRPGVRVTTVEELGITQTSVSGAGICVTGEENNCPDVYNNVGADLLIGVANGKLSFAAHVGVDVVSLAEMSLAARLGGLGRYAASSKLSIVFDPRVQVGLTDRDFNGDALDVPVWVWFEASPTFGAYVHTGFSGPFDGLADSFNVPLGLGASFHASSRLTLGADFHFSNLIGKGGNVDGRVLGLRLAVRI